jgi:predicted nucleic acid-binding protein
VIVVSDTSAICYLVLIEEVEVLARLFGEILIPASVRSELAALGAPEEVRAWIQAPPPWLRVRTVEPGLVQGDPDLDLHAGEREVLALASELAADLVILDDKAARQQASDLGLRVTGLLGILDRAARDQHLDLLQSVRRLRATSFRAAPALLHRLLQRHGGV